MTWRLPEQDPCTEPCCTGDLKRPFDEVGGAGATSRGIQTYPDERYCGPDDLCGYCTPPTVTAEWIERTDPSPVTEPSPFGFTEFGQRIEPSPGVMHRIFNATRRNT